MHDFTKEDRLAIQYIGGSEDERREVATALKAIPAPRSLKILVWILTSFFIFLGVGFDLAIWSIIQQGWDLDKAVIGIINALVPFGIWKT